MDDFSETGDLSQLFEDAHMDLLAALQSIEGWRGQENRDVVLELRQILDELEILSEDESLLLGVSERARLDDALERLAYVQQDMRDTRWKGSGSGLYYEYVRAAHTALQTIPERIERLQASALVLADTDSETPIAVAVLELATAALLDAIGSDPEAWTRLGSRRFEEILAEIWDGLGWQTLLTPPAKDGGFDIRAIRNSSGMCLCYLVEAKSYRPDRPVGIAAVRHLYGVVEREQASHGVIATTSRFTRDAQAEAALLKYRVTLADFQQVLAWVAEYRRLKFGDA